MKPAHLVVVGATGAGKTSLSRILVHPLPRLVVFDQSEDPIWDTVGGTFRDPGQAVDFLYDHLRSDYQAVLRFRRSETYLPVLAALFEAHEGGGLPPLVVVMEESAVWSGTHEIPEPLKAVATRGRRAGLVLVSIAQETTMLNPTLRRQAFVMVTLRQQAPLPSDLKGQLTPSEQQQVQQLQTVTPFTTPEAGVHYLTRPPGVDPYRRLLLSAGQTASELPADYQPPRPS